MSMPQQQEPIPAHFKLAFKPIADPEAVIQFGHARFTILTDRLIRLEYHPLGHFEDRASQAFWHRQQPVPRFTSRLEAHTLEIETDYLHLTYQRTDKEGFAADNLTIMVKTTLSVWHPGLPAAENLLGTTRTLDMVNGDAPLSQGLMSRAGWSIVDDSATLVFNDQSWIEPRQVGGTDWYFFGYGHDYKACLQDYCRVSGEMPLVPRWILGNWWSRYWAYHQDSLTELINDLEAHALPFSVCIIDMDWHLTETGNASSGWTGYTWNRKLFPDPSGMIDFLHQKGLKTALNLHPAEGIHDHEEQYPAMARRLGIDPATRTPIKFDITSPAFTNAYFEVLHHPQEAMGVDFWWMDWQQGQTCNLPGLDPLWLINHLHFYDIGRDGQRRPFIFSRWGNEGHQRYPIGFSGDSYRTWESLRFETYMTPAAANVAYGWWSHDIGGHTGGFGEPELLARWIQFGVLSPINRLHTTKGEFYDNRPWVFEDAEILRVIREALQFRHALIPYLYTMAYRTYQQSLPLLMPMYYEYPEMEEAYHCPHQYLFGTELVAAPFVDPIDPETQLSRQVVWLPEGDWVHFFTGEHFKGNGWHAIYGKLRDIPLFAKVGAIVPMAPHIGWGGVGNPDTLDIHIFAGADNTFTLYEDDGETTAYRQGHACLTTISQQWAADHLTLSIAAPIGDINCIPAQRTYNLIFHGVSQAAAITAQVDGTAFPVTGDYDAQTETLTLSAIEVEIASAIEISLHTADLLARRDRRREKVLRMLMHFRGHINVRNRLADNIDAILHDPNALGPYIVMLSNTQAQAIFETLYEAGIHTIYNTDKPDRVILWNNKENQAITYRYGDAYVYVGMLEGSPHYAQGVLPRFLTFTPPVYIWHHGVNGKRVHPTHWQAQIDYFNLLTVVCGFRQEAP